MADQDRALSLAAARHDVIPVMLVDPRDEELPDVGLGSFEDFETGDSVIVDTSSPAVRAHYAKRMKATTVELDTSHVPMLSKPDLVIDVIRKAVAAFQKS